MGEIIELLQEGFSLDSLVARISLPGLLATMGVALLCALLIYLAYRFFYPGAIYSANFNLLLVLVALITAMIIMTISSNIILSLGMVGALSIVRFRTAVKDPLDVGFLFLAIGAGITAGAGLYLIAVAGTLLILLIFVLMSLIKGRGTIYLLVVSYDNRAETHVDQLARILPARLKSKTVTPSTTELSLQVKLQKGSAKMLERFNAVPGVQSAVLLEFPNENTV